MKFSTAHTILFEKRLKMYEMLPTLSTLFHQGYVWIKSRKITILYITYQLAYLARKYAKFLGLCYAFSNQRVKNQIRLEKIGI